MVLAEPIDWLSVRVGTFLSFLQPLKVLFTIWFMLLGVIICLRLSHHAKASSPVDTTSSGIVTLLRLSQFSKTL